MTRKLIPRSSWLFPTFRMPSFFDEQEDERWLEQLSEPSGLSVFEDDKTVTIEAALPGLKSDEIEMTFERGMLWIKGEKREQEEDKKKKYYRKALSSFSYRISVPGDIDEESEPEATYNQGILRVVFKKASKSEPKKISIKSA